MIEEKHNEIVISKTDNLINALEEKINSPDYNPSEYEKYLDEKRLQELQTYKTDDLDGESSISDRAGGVCPAKKVDADNAREKCSFDFKYRKYLFEDGLDKLYDTLEDCIENIVYYSKPWQITKKTDLMVETNPILNTKQYVEFSFFSCSNEYEQMIGSNVVCKTTT